MRTGGESRSGGRAPRVMPRAPEARQDAESPEPGAPSCSSLQDFCLFSKGGAACGDFLRFSETTGPSWRAAAPRPLGSAVPQGICSSDLPRGRGCGSGERDCPGWHCFSCGDRSPDRAVRRGLQGRWHFLGRERLPMAMSPCPVWCEHRNVTRG